MARACFPNVSSVSFCFQDTNYAYDTLQRILTKIRACEHLQKFCQHEQASTHLVFASNSNKGQILRALSNWMGPFHTPSWDINFNTRREIPYLQAAMYYSFYDINILTRCTSRSVPTSSHSKQMVIGNLKKRFMFCARHLFVVKYSKQRQMS